MLQTQYATWSASGGATDTTRALLSSSGLLNVAQIFDNVVAVAFDGMLECSSARAATTTGK